MGVSLSSKPAASTATAKPKAKAKAKAKAKDASAACPCNGGSSAASSAFSAGRPPRPLALSACCGRYLEGMPAPDAEQLMRSRYSAFVLERRGYLLATWHASTRPGTLDFGPQARWLGLQVRSHRVLGAGHAEVEFVARYRVAGRAVRLHETSRFVCEGGCWFYVDGDLHGDSV